MQLTVIMSLIFAIVIAIFAGLNSSVVEVNLFFIKKEVSLAIVILISSVFGASLVYMINILKSVKLKVKSKALEKQNLLLNNEIRKYETKIEELMAKLEVKEEVKDEV